MLTKLTFVGDLMLAPLILLLFMQAPPPVADCDPTHPGCAPKGWTLVKRRPVQQGSVQQPAPPQKPPKPKQQAKPK